MNIALMIAIFATVAVFAAVLLNPTPVSAHCDTDDGPAVSDGRRALVTGNINYALKWIGPDGEDELRDAFDRARAAAATDQDAFLETLVRIHRAGEGAGFDGIKPAGVGVSPVIAAADAALKSGSLDQLTELVAADRISRLRALFDQALARREFDVDDVATTSPRTSPMSSTPRARTTNTTGTPRRIFNDYSSKNAVRLRRTPVGAPRSRHSDGTEHRRRLPCS